MVETIAPVVYGRRREYVTAIVLHALGATATAALTGAAFGAVGLLAGAPWGTVGTVGVIVVAVVYAARESFRLPVPLPNARRQVPEWWRTFYSPPVAATLYGAGLGVAFATFLSYGTFVAVAAAAVAAGDPLIGAAVCAPFGLARAVAVAFAGKESSDPSATVASLERLATTSWPRLANAAALLLVGTVLATAL